MEKAEFPSLMCPLTAGEGARKGELGMAQPKPDPQGTPEGRMSLTPFVQQPQTPRAEFAHPSLGWGNQFSSNPASV